MSLILLVAFQNCNQTAFDNAGTPTTLAASPVGTSGGLTPVPVAANNGGTEGYDGLVAYRMMTSNAVPCSDGSNVESQIMASTQVAVMTRDNCAQLSTPQNIDVSQITFVSNNMEPMLIYQANTYVYNTTPSQPAQFAYLCTGGLNNLSLSISMDQTTGLLSVSGVGGAGTYSLQKILTVYQGSDGNGDNIQLALIVPNPDGSYFGALTYTSTIGISWNSTVTCYP